MDIYMDGVQSHLTLVDKLLRARLAHLDKQTTKLSRHYNRVAHTRAMIGLVEELRGLVEQDPDLWDDNVEIVPF